MRSLIGEDATMFSILFVLLLLQTVWGKASLPDPSFVTKGRNASVVVGDNVTMPCVVANKGANAVMWFSADDAVISANGVKLRVDSRLDIESGKGLTDATYAFNLSLSFVNLEDEGLYKCSINTRFPLVEVNYLTVNIPPNIVRHSAQLIEADLHDNVTLTCTATGKPQPIVTWTRVGGTLPSGAQFLRGDRLVLTDIHGQHNGVYECTADNGVLQPVKASTTLHIEHSPLLRTPNLTTVYTGREESAKLVCGFEAKPLANVTWYKEGRPAISKDAANRGVTIQREHHVEVSIMNIYGVRESDFGNYTCIVKNVLGTAQAMFDLSGLAKPPVVSSSTHGRYSSVYTLTWSVTSYEMPSSYQIMYRTAGVNGTDNGDWKDLNLRADEQTDASTKDHKEIHIHQYKFEGLMPSTAYEVKIRVENHFGYGDFSEPFIFETREGGFTPPPPTSAEPWSNVQVSYTYNADLTSGSMADRLTSRFWSLAVVHGVIGLATLLWTGI